MKRLSLILVLAFVAMPGLRAQESFSPYHYRSPYKTTYSQHQYHYPEYQHHHISASYGLSAIDMAFSLLIDGNHLHWNITDKEYFAFTTSGLGGGNYNVGYSYRFLNDWLSLGAALSINSLSIYAEDYYFRIPLLTGKAFSILTFARFDFVRTEMCRLYTKAALGAMCLTGTLVGSKGLTGSAWLPSAHISVFGFEVQPLLNLSAFVELGVGMQGILQTGIALHF